MAKGRLPKRGKNGRFLKGGTARANPSRKRKPKSRSSAAPRKRRARAAASTSAPRRRRSYRRNPGKLSPKNILRDLKQGAMDAGGIIVGEAAARIIPQRFNLPKQGPLGLAVQAGVAVLAGVAASRFVGKDVGRMVLAGGLAAPLKTFIVAQGVPVLAPALSPITAAGELGAYVGGGARTRTPVRGYVTPPPAAAARGMAGYVESRDSLGNGYDFATM